MVWQVNKGSDLPEQLYPGRVLYNPDGSIASLPADDEVVSRQLVCDMCGRPFDDKADVLRIKNKVYHDECIDSA